MLCPSAGYNLF